MTRQPSRWEAIIAANPAHSTWYVERFRAMREQGADLDGEARLVDAMLARGSRVLDAGAGTGRVGGALHARGHTVVGVDVDPVLVAEAEAVYPGPTWLQGDLTTLDLPARGIAEPFDAVVLAGNVLTFLAPGSHAETLATLARHLAPEGRIVLGFGTARDYDVAQLADDVTTAGLVEDLRLGTWDLRPWTPDSSFVVAVLRAARRKGATA